MAKRNKPIIISAPKRIEEKYYQELNKYIKAVEKWVKENIIPKLSEWVELERRELRADSAEIRFDDSKKQMDDMFNRLNSLSEDMFGTPWAELISNEGAAATNIFNDDKNGRSLRRVLGVDVVAAEPWLKPRIQKFVSQNVDLISSLRSEHLRKIKLQVGKVVENGVRNETYAAQIEAQFGSELAKVTSNVQARAKLIARDQISKLNGQLTETRQTAAGFTHYQWVTAGDERVRDSHRAKNGKIFKWSEPPSDTGHPGDDFQCRCYASPVLTEDMESDVSLRRLFNR